MVSACVRRTGKGTQNGRDRFTMPVDKGNTVAYNIPFFKEAQGATWNGRRCALTIPDGGSRVRETGFEGDPLIFTEN